MTSKHLQSKKLIWDLQWVFFSHLVSLLECNVTETSSKSLLKWRRNCLELQGILWNGHGRWKCLKVRGVSSGRGHGERVEREPKRRSRVGAPSVVQEPSPWWGVREAKPPWSWKLFGSWMSHGVAKLIPLSVFSKVFNRDMVQVYSQNLVSMVRIGCAVRKWIDVYETSSLMASTIQVR